MIVSRKRVSTNPLANLANRPLYESPTIQTKVPVAIPRSLFWNDNVYYHSRRGSKAKTPGYSPEPPGLVNAGRLLVA
jgi:hypothetical protein